MAPIKCSYVNCGNTTSSHSLFRFPCSDANRLRIWINNSGNLNLTSLSPEELKNRYLCSVHFDGCYIHKNEQRCRLSNTSIPRHHHAEDESIVVIRSPATSPSSTEYLKVKTPVKIYRKRQHENIVSASSSSSPISSEFGREMEMPTPPKKKKMDYCMKPHCTQTRMRLNNLRKHHQKTKQQVAMLKKTEKTGKKLEKDCYPSDSSKVLALMQLRQKKRKWTNEEKNFSLALFYKSPTSYKFMKDQGIVLPGITTIKRWLTESDTLPGFCATTFKMLKIKFESSSLSEKTCMVTFDEMSIMSCLEYNKKHDFIEGFEDLGNTERTGNLAKYVLVFLVRGIYVSYKIPVCYFLSKTNVKAEKLQTIIKVVLNKLFDAGLLPKATVCDQVSTNQSAMRALGASNEHPFYFVNGRKIFALFDVPHCLKNIRNNWLQNDFVIDDKGNEVSFKDVISTYEIDQKNKSRALLKITPVHLAPNSFQKMKVKLAAQIFSHSVGAAITTAVKTGELKTPTATNTANFIFKMNDLFDALNSKVKIDKNPHKSGLTKTNKAWSALEEGKAVLVKLKKINIKNGKRNLTVPPSFLGFQQSINAITQFFDEESTAGMEYLLTNRLCQDALENLFSIYRLRSGNNKNPTARVFRSIFRSSLTKMLIKLPGHQNCENQDEIEDDDLPQNTIADKTSGSSLVPVPSTSQIEGQKKVIEANNEQIMPIDIGVEKQSENVTLEQCSVTYFAGWLAKCSYKKYQCKKCPMTKDFDLEDKNQMLILEKTYSNIGALPTLKCPSDTFYKIIDVALTVFQDQFDALKHKRNLKKTLLSCITITMEIDFSDLYSLFCKEHVNFALEKMITTKIFFFCKTQKRNAIQSQQKIRLLKHK